MERQSTARSAIRPRITRDPARTRSAILDAAEALFARRGYDATTLADIGEAAGVSRGTPSYFFGSKDELYVEVLERMYAIRNQTLGPVFSPLVGWAEATYPPCALRSVLATCVAGYLKFLRERPAYVDILQREALAGGERLAQLENQSTVMEDAFAALRRFCPRHGLKAFDVPEAVMCIVGLGYMPIALRHTILPRHGLELDDDRFISRRTEHIVDVLMHVLGAS